MIGILSDAHGNFEAFRRALQLLRRLGAERFIFLGDAVGYIPSTHVVSDLMKLGEAVQCVSGNHEKMILHGGFKKNSEDIYKSKLVSENLSKVQLDFIKTWPDSIKEKYPTCNALYIHGGPNDFTNEYVYPDSDLSKYTVSDSFIFMGHSHYPFLRKSEGTTFVNVGSCGMPRDNGSYGAFATFEPSKASVIIYRYEITDITNTLKHSKIQIHEKVLQVFERKKEDLVGTLIY